MVCLNTEIHYYFSYFLLIIGIVKSESLIERFKRGFQPGWRTTSLTAADRWSHHVALCIQGSGTNRFVCGGSIIDNQWVLTAAHCLRNSFDQPRIARTVQVKVGTSVHRSDSCTVNVGNEALYDVEGIVFHPYFNVPLRASNDVALIKLYSPIRVIPGYVEPIKLHRRTPPFRSMETCIAMGFGETTSSTFSEFLTQVELKIISHRKCIDFFRKEDPDCATGIGCIDTSMFCAGVPDGSIDTCRGDSGGSFVCRTGSTWYLAGITSFSLPGRPCGQNGYGVYSNTDRMIGFVDETINPNGRVSEIKVMITGTANEECPQQYTHRVQADFNFGVKYYTYICYTKSTFGPFITDLDIVRGSRRVQCPPGFRKIPKDLQEGHQYNGEYIFLCYKYGPNSRTYGVSDIISFDTFEGHPEPTPPGYKLISTKVGHNQSRKAQLGFRVLF